MTDRFIDDLFNTLHAEREGRLSDAARKEQRTSAFQQALRIWWDEFVDVLGQKIGAWNEKHVGGDPVHFTTRSSGGVRISHQTAADVELRLHPSGVEGIGRIGKAGGMKQILVDIWDAGDGQVSAGSMQGGQTFTSPTAAAEHVVEPILRASFGD